MREDTSDVVVLTTRPHEAAAGLLVHALRDEGIQAEPVGALTAGFRAEAPGVVRILVHRHDLEAAQALLAELDAGVEAIDWDDVDVGEME